MVRAGAARALRLFAVVAAATGAVSLAIGLLTGAGVSRSLSLGWYVTGAFLLLLGFAAGSRGPTRADAPVGVRLRARRWATRDEQEDALNFSALLVALGLALLVLGVLADRRHPLF